VALGIPALELGDSRLALDQRVEEVVGAVGDRVEGAQPGDHHAIPAVLAHLLASTLDAATGSGSVSAAPAADAAIDDAAIAWVISTTTSVRTAAAPFRIA